MSFPEEAEKLQALLWSAAERRRVRERFRATLAGLLELEILWSKHRSMVDGVLGREKSRMDNVGQLDRRSLNGPTGGYQYHVQGSHGSLRVTRSLSQEVVSDSGGSRDIWAWSNWASEDLLPPHQQHFCYAPPDAQLRANLAQADSKSGSSSGFCDDDFYADEDEEHADGSSLSGSRSSLNSQPLRIPKREDGEGWGNGSLSTLTVAGGIPASGFLSVADLCPESHWWHVSGILHAQVSLDQKYCMDLMAGQSQEAYRFPSPLHAVALQSPIYACTQSAARCPRGAGRSKSCSLPAGLTAGPWKMGCSPATQPKRHKHDRRHDNVQRYSSATSCLCPACVSPSSASGGWPSRHLPTHRGVEGRGRAENYPSSVLHGHKQHA